MLQLHVHVHKPFRASDIKLSHTCMCWSEQEIALGEEKQGNCYNLKPFLSCSSESIVLQLGAFVLRERLTAECLSACFTMKTKLVYTPKFTF